MSDGNHQSPFQDRVMRDYAVSALRAAGHVKRRLDDLRSVATVLGEQDQAWMAARLPLDQALNSIANVTFKLGQAVREGADCGA